MLGSFAALSAVLALLGGLVFLLGRWNRGWAPSGALRVIAALELGAGRHVAVVQAGKRHFLLGTTQQNVSLLAELQAEDVSAAERLQAAGGAPVPQRWWARLSARKARVETGQTG